MLPENNNAWLLLLDEYTAALFSNLTVWLAKNELKVSTESFASLPISSVKYFPSSHKLKRDILASLVRHLRRGIWEKALWKSGGRGGCVGNGKSWAKLSSGLALKQQI